MLGPFLPARIEKRHDIVIGGIDSGQIRTLVQVAGPAGEGQVRFDGLPAMLPRDNMLDLEPEERLILLAHVTILAPVDSALANEFT